MKNQLIERWSQEELIGINNLSRQDGTVVLFNHTSLKVEGSTQHYCQPICETTIESIEKYDEDIWTDFQVFCRTETGQHTYVGGQGAMGNEGFLACLDKNEEPIWTLFFVYSNPFYELNIIDGVLEAVSSLDLKFYIDLDFPERIKISHFEWK